MITIMPEAAEIAEPHAVQLKKRKPKARKA